MGTKTIDIVGNVVKPPSELLPPVPTGSDFYIDETFIYLYRKLIEHPIFRNKNHFLVKCWVWCIIRANYTEREILFNGQIEKLKKGEFITGRKVAANEMFCSESEFYKSIKIFQKIGLIELKTNNRFSKIYLIKYKDLQNNGVKPNNNRTTTEQQPNNNGTQTIIYNNTNKDNNKAKRSKNVNNFVIPTIEEVIKYWQLSGYGNTKEAERFWHSYNTKGWLVQGRKMVNWHSAAYNWNSRKDDFKNNSYKSEEIKTIKPIPKCPECHYNLTDGGICYTPECSKHGQKVNLLAEIMNGIHKVEV